MASVTAQQGQVVETRFTTSSTASTSFVLLSHGGATFIQGIQSTGRVFCWNSLISNDHYTGLQGGFAHISSSYHTEYDRYIATLVHVLITLRALLAFWVHVVYARGLRTAASQRWQVFYGYTAVSVETVLSFHEHPCIQPAYMDDQASTARTTSCLRRLFSP